MVSSRVGSTRETRNARFDVSVDPSSEDGARHYQRQRARRAFVALEHDGSHLVAVDADLDPVRLRARHPDRGSVIILPL